MGLGDRGGCLLTSLRKAGRQAGRQAGLMWKCFVTISEYELQLKSIHLNYYRKHNIHCNLTCDIVGYLLSSVTDS
jgi:hypothetical protein